MERVLEILMYVLNVLWIMFEFILIIAAFCFLLFGGDLSLSLDIDFPWS